MARGIQEFARAVAARHRRRDQAETCPAQRLDAGAHRFAGFRERGRILYDALDQACAPDFELRLDETDEPRRARRQAQEMREDEALRDEADIADDRSRRLADL